jgi:hypothetical protein
MISIQETDLRRYLGTLPRDELILLLKNSFGDRVGLQVEASFPVTQTAFEKLSNEDVDSIEEAIAAQFGGRC